MFGFLGAHCAEDGLIQFHIQNLAIEKDDGADNLILSGGSHFSINGQVGNEDVDFRSAHAEGVFFVVEKDKAAHPGYVGKFGAE